MSAKAKKGPETWLNRIVEHAEVAPKDLVAHPYNARTHPTPQEAALVGSINDVGFYRSVTVNKRTGHILDGHLRVELAIKQGQKTIPVEYVDIPEELEAEVLLTADPLAALAEYNKESLDHLLREIQTGEPALQQMLAELAAESGLTYGTQEPAQAPEPEIDRAAELLEKWQVERGQLWECGRHRIMCGDSTSSADVDTLFSNEIDCLCWDPPFNIGFEYDGAFAGQDSKNAKEYACWLKSCLALIETRLAKEHTCFVWQGMLNIRYFAEWFEGYDWRLISVAKGFVQARPTWLQWATDPVIAWTSGNVHHPISHRDFFYNGQASNTSPSPDRLISGLHPCPRSVEVCVYFIDGWAREGGNVADLSLGSGTTMCAAEQAGRTCYGMEIEPEYVAVTLERMFQMTGKTPLLADRVTYTVHSTNA